MSMKQEVTLFVENLHRMQLLREGYQNSGTLDHAYCSGLEDQLSEDIDILLSLAKKFHFNVFGRIHFHAISNQFEIYDCSISKYRPFEILTAYDIYKRCQKLGV